MSEAQPGKSPGTKWVPAGQVDGDGKGAGVRLVIGAPQPAKPVNISVKSNIFTTPPIGLFLGLL